MAEGGGAGAAVSEAYRNAYNVRPFGCLRWVGGRAGGFFSSVVHGCWWHMMSGPLHWLYVNGLGISLFTPCLTSSLNRLCQFVCRIAALLSVAPVYLDL